MIRTFFVPCNNWKDHGFDVKQIEYLTMVRSICEPIENYENYERKIIKHIEKEIVVDKNNC